MDPNLTIALAALMVGLAKGGLGPLGGLLAPLLSQVMPVQEAVGLTLPLLMIGDVFALRAYWKQWNTRYVRLLLPAAVVGIVLGVLLLKTLPDTTMRTILGIVTLITVAYKLASDSIKRLAYQPRDWHGTVAGGVGGFASALANAGGPPITAYMLLQKLEPTVFISTQVLFFAIINALKLPIFLSANVIDLQRLLSIAPAMLLIPVGVWLGYQVIKRMDRRLFDWFITATLLWAGLSLLFG